MLQHEAFLNVFSDAVSGRIEPFLRELSSPAGERERRLAIYRNNVAHSLGQALAARFPVVERLLGQDCFAATAQLYRQVAPPRSPVLHEWGEDFSAFLADLEPFRALGYLPEVARIEFARGRAYHAADVAPVAADRLARIASTGVDFRLALHPSVQIFRGDWAAVTIWQMNQPGARAAEIDAAVSENALVLRDHAGEVPVIAVSDAEADLVIALQRGETISTATEIAGPHINVANVLAQLIAAGTITEIG